MLLYIIPETKSRTNLYNTTLDHGITGHFSSDYSEKKAKPTEMVVRQIPGTDQFAVVRRDLEARPGDTIIFNKYNNLTRGGQILEQADLESQDEETFK